MTTRFRSARRIVGAVLGAALAIGCPCGTHAAGPAVAVVAAGLQFPEGMIFVGNGLYFVDYTRSSVLLLRDPSAPGAKPELVWHLDGCGANGLVAVPGGGFWVACFDAGTLVQVSPAGTTVATIRQDAQGHALTAPNDFAADAKGGFYVSDSGSDGHLGRVLYLGRDGAVREVASGIRFANGVGVSPDGGTLYVTESPTGKVLAFSIAADGSLGPARDLVQLRDIVPPGRSAAVTPDSLRVDREGRVYIACITGQGVAILSRDGRLLKLVEVPAEHHTTLAISPDGRTLFVTAVDDDPLTTYRGEIVRTANPFAP